MREIKFRAWDNEEKNFIYFDALEGLLSECDETYRQRCVGQFEQFTGLRDKNGKEIYEGDLIAGGLLSEPCKVMYQETCGRFIAFGTHYKVLAHKFEQFEVIGNIHENPELLEASC